MRRSSFPAYGMTMLGPRTGGAYGELVSPNAEQYFAQEFLARQLGEAQPATVPFEGSFQNYLQNMQGTTGYAPRGMVSTGQMLPRTATMTDQALTQGVSPFQKTHTRQMPPPGWNDQESLAGLTPAFGSTAMRANKFSVPKASPFAPMTGVRKQMKPSEPGV